jgi:elongation factor Tu
VNPVKGQVVCKPGSITPHTRFNAEVYVLTADESGISAPLYNGQTSQFYFLTTDVFGSISLGENTEPTLPGDDIIGLIELQTPVAMEQGSRFALRQGNVTVGVGVVVEIIN